MYACSVSVSKEWRWCEDNEERSSHTRISQGVRYIWQGPLFPSYPKIIVYSV